MLADLIETVRVESFNAEEVKRIEYLVVGRKGTAFKKVGKSTGVVDEAVSEESEEEADEGKEVKKENFVCKNIFQKSYSISNTVYRTHFPGRRYSKEEHAKLGEKDAR
jgi:hypothetical protein